MALSCSLRILWGFSVAAIVSISGTSALIPKAFVPKTVVSASKTELKSGPIDFTANVPGKGKLEVSFVPEGTPKPEPEPKPDPEPEPKPLPNDPLPDVLQGVHLPTDEEQPPRIDNDYSNLQAIKYAQISGTLKGYPNGIFSLLGQSKSNLFIAQGFLEEVSNLNANIPSSSEYKFFGNGDHAKTLTLLLKTNPFMASALRETSDGGFELKSYDPKETKPSLYLQLLRTLTGVGRRVNFEFDSKMQIKLFSVYDDLEGNKIEGDLDMQKYASAALYNLVFYAQCQHTTVHVLHYLMTAAFQVASKDFEAMNKWATSYAKNLYLKYKQMGELLVAYPKNPKTLAIITGSDGFGSSRAVIPILKNLLDEWGESPTASGFLETMMNVSTDKMDHAGILVEFRKHAKLSKPFAAEAASSLRETDPLKYTVAETKMQSYLQRCGCFKSKIASFDQWIELMSVTGMLHGGTLSFTRLLGIADVVRWKNVQGQTWEYADLLLVSTGLLTIVGMEDGRHVMSSTTSHYTDKLQAVLDKYDAKTTALKTKYKASLMASPEFNDFGWILSDYCPDDFDGKQLTIATYI